MSVGPRDYDVHYHAANELEEQAKRAKDVLTRLAAHLAATDPHRDIELKDLVERKHVIQAAELFFGSDITSSPEPTQPVFISFSDQDKDFVKDLTSKLDDAHVTAFVADRDIQLATDWAEKIWEAIRGCRVFVSVLTPRFLNSRWFYLEAGAACASKKVVLPVLRYVRRSDVKTPFDRFQSMTVESSLQLDELVEKLRELCS